MKAIISVQSWSGPSLGALAALLLSLPLASGCGKSDPPRVPVVPVSGKITVGKEIPVGAQIVLHSQGHSLPEGAAPIGKVGSDGTFTVSIYGEGDGVPSGEYVATVQWYKIVKTPDGESMSGPNVIPKKYTSPTTSPIKVSVGSSATQLPPINIPAS